MIKIIVLVTFTFLFAHADTSTEVLYKNTYSTLAKMIEANPTSPPGNEERIVKIASSRFKDAGIKFEISEFAPGRQNIVARLKGTVSQPPMLLLAHTDVVGTDNQTWSVPKHKLTEKDGFLYGRGVEDDLGMAALLVETLIEIKNSKVVLNRDIIVALTGDEETAGLGIQHILKTNPDSIRAEFALNEGGYVALDKNDKVQYVSLQVAEKIAQNFEVLAKGKSGHSSVPAGDNAIYNLSRALNKLSKYKRPARLIPAVRAFYLARAQIEKPPRSLAMLELAKSKGRLPTKALDILETDPVDAANLRTTCVATVIDGGTRVNALPAEARANINCRILPDESIEDIRKDLQKVIADPNIEIKTLGNESASPASDPNSKAALAIKKITNDFWPSIPLIPTMSRGATDSSFLRSFGMSSYGITPFPITEEDRLRAHGIDERISVESLKSGSQFFYKLVLGLATE